MVRSHVHFHKLHSADGELVTDSSNDIPCKGVMNSSHDECTAPGNVAPVSQRWTKKPLLRWAPRVQEIREPMTQVTATLESIPGRRDTTESREDRKIVKRSKMAMKKKFKRSTENNNTYRKDAGDSMYIRLLFLRKQKHWGRKHI